MLKQLEVDALKADLQSVKNLLAARTPEQDPVGYLQFDARRRDIEQQLAEVQDRKQYAASIGLFFDGQPVRASKGIAADFGARAIEQFQNIVSTRRASRDAPNSARRTTRQRSQMMITDVVRGSFGFVLEDANSDAEENTEMQSVLNEVIDLLYRSGDQSQDIFEEAAELLDERVLVTVQAFFKLLDTSSASIRLVDNSRDVTIDKDDVRRARERVDNLSFSESVKIIRGLLYVMPVSKKFELVEQGGTVIRGAISADGLESLTSESGIVGSGSLATWCNIEVQIREVRVRGQSPRYTYKLLKVITKGDSDPEPSLPKA